MRWFSILAILMLIKRSLAPCCFADGASAAHAQMFLHTIASDHSAMPCHEIVPTSASGIDGSFVIPFGDWQSFLANFYLAVLPHAFLSAILLALVARIHARDFIGR